MDHGHLAVEIVKRIGDARAPRPILHQSAAARQGLVRVAGAKLARHIGEPRRKEEDLHAQSRLHERMQEMEEDACVIIHRAGDVAKRNNRRMANAPASVRELDGGAPGTQ